MPAFIEDFLIYVDNDLLNIAIGFTVAEEDF